MYTNIIFFIPLTFDIITRYDIMSRYEIGEATVIR